MLWCIDRLLSAVVQSPTHATCLQTRRAPNPDGMKSQVTDPDPMFLRHLHPATFHLTTSALSQDIPHRNTPRRIGIALGQLVHDTARHLCRERRRTAALTSQTDVTMPMRRLLVDTTRTPSGRGDLDVLALPTASHDAARQQRGAQQQRVLGVLLHGIALRATACPTCSRRRQVHVPGRRGEWAVRKLGYPSSPADLTSSIASKC